MVGVKVLRERFARDMNEVERFHREAERGQQLVHKNIVPIYNVGQQGHFHYFTMEFIEGGNLRELSNIRGKVGIIEATNWIMNVAAALEHVLKFMFLGL